MNLLRKSNTSSHSLSLNKSPTHSLQRLAFPSKLKTSDTNSSINHFPSLPSVNSINQSTLPFKIHTMSTHELDRSQGVILDGDIYHQNQGATSEYYIQTGIHNAPIIQPDPKRSKRPFKFKRNLEFVPILMGHFCFHPTDKRLKSLPAQIKRCLSERSLGRRLGGVRQSKKRVRLEDRVHREEYPDSRPHVIDGKVQYSVCRIPSPHFVKSGTSGESKVTRLGSEVSIREIGSGIQNPAMYSITKFQQPGNRTRAKNLSISRNQSPNMSPRSLSPVTSRIIIPNTLKQSFIEPLVMLSMKTSHLPIHSPKQSKIQSPPVSPKSSYIASNAHLPPLSPRPGSPPLTKPPPESLKKLPNIPLSTSQVKSISPKNSFVRNPISFTSRVNDFSQDLLSSQISGSGIITNLKSMTLKTGASSGMFTQDSIQQTDQYQLDPTHQPTRFRYSNTSIKS